MANDAPTAASGNQNTVNVAKLPVKILDSIFQATADGNWDGLSEIPFFIDDISAIQPALDGFAGIGEESRIMDANSRRQIPAQVEGEMPNVPENLRVDLAQGLAGLFAIYRLGFARGQGDTVEKVKNKLNNGELVAPGSSVSTYEASNVEGLLR